MLKNYLKVALRTFARNRLITFINIFGLGLSMSIGMMTMVRLQDQLSYDNFHPSPERTYRILSDYHKKTGEHWKMASTPLPLKDKLTDLASIENSVNIYPALKGKAVSEEGKELYINGAFTEPSFFQVFGFSLRAGNPADALQKPDGVVISRNTAEKFFGQTDPLGKILTLEPGKNLVVTGVLDDIPAKSHIDFDAYVSSAAIAQFEKDKIIVPRSSDWYAFNTAYTYVVVKKGYATNTLRNELKNISRSVNKNNNEGSVAFALQAIGKITPGRELLFNETGKGGSWTKFYFEIGVSLIILLAACFNYTNLTIARALTRAKEVGVRKINGANRSQIFVQYITESVLLSLLSLCFAWVLLSFIVQHAPFNDDYEYIPSSFRYNTTLIGWSIAFALFTGLLAGVSPAWILSSFQPLRILKNLTTARILGKVSIQKTLIVFQYSLSLTIIIFLLTFYRQFSHMAASDPGFKRDNVLVVPLHGLDEKIVTQKITEIPGVRSVSAMSGSFNKHFNGLNVTVWLNNKPDAIPLNYYYADASFVRNMKLDILAGNNFSTGDDHEQYMLVNEQAVRALGLKDNQRAIGQKVWINDSSKWEIKGVFRDFSYENAGKDIMPLALRSKKNAYQYLYVNVDGVDKSALNSRVLQVMTGLAPSPIVEPVWLDEQLAKSNSQAATISLLGYLAFMAVAIASLGLLGLVIYTVEVKRKEISIRKIIGAGKRQLVHMLSKGFIKLLFIAGLIAVPIGYTAGYLFLQNFSNRVNSGIMGALLCFLALLVIGLVTIISQTYKAAAENPVKSLRTE